MKMKQGNRRSTIEEVQEMIRLRRGGMSLMKIARRFGRDHTTVLWWIRKAEREGELKIYKGNKQIPVAKVIKRKTKKEIEKERQQKIKKGNLCVICLGPKSLKWEKTRVCSLECWDKNNVGHRTKTERGSNPSYMSSL